jgi:hypothetical protein
MKNLDGLLQKAATTFTLLPRAHCLQVWATFRAAHGMTGQPDLLCKGNTNLKVGKSKVFTYLLTLAAHRTSGVFNVCVKSTAQCRKACVMLTAGNAFYSSVKDGRSARTVFAGEHPQEFLSLLTHEVRALEAKGVMFGLRLNVASDLRWEFIAPWLFEGPNVRGYDYTKWAPEDRFGFAPERYRLTYSHSERMSGEMVDTMIDHMLNVAVVFDCHKHDLPATWRGHRVIDGDLSDYRYDDPTGVIVGLAAKGSAKTLQVGGFKQGGGAS